MGMMHRYRVRVQTNSDISGRLFSLGWRRIKGTQEWLFERESEEELRTEMDDVLGGYPVEIAEVTGESHVVTVNRSGEASRSS